MDRERAMQIRVGFFVLMAFVIFLVTVFVLGREKNLFKHHVKLYAYFSGISGLKPSAPVRLAGVDIGTVSAIELPGKPGDKLIRVTLKLNDDVMNHIRADSEASIDSQGLLGDKLINISIGSAESPTIKDGATIKSLDVPDLSKVIDTGREALENIRQITRDLKKTVSGLSTEAVQGDLKDIIHTVSMMTRGVVDGPGLLHDIIFDKKLQDEGHAIASNVNEISRKVSVSATRVDSVIQQAQEGPGTLHELVYHNGAKQVLDNVGTITNDIKIVTTAVREEKTGLIHELIWGTQGKIVMDDLQAATRDIKATMADVKDVVATIKKGDGTIGALINDPTIYEDIKTILGNLKRNEILKALVRYTISKGDEKPSPAK